MYYIRKLSKLSTVTKIKNLSDIMDTPADLLRQEWSTSKNTLSFWKCESLTDTKDTLKAILLSSTGIEKSKFIIFDDIILDKYEIRRDYSEEGKTGYLGYEKLHVNLCELTYGKIGNIISMTKHILNDEQLIIELSRENVKAYIKEVCDAGLINIEKTNDNLLADIEKYRLIAA